MEDVYSARGRTLAGAGILSRKVQMQEATIMDWRLARNFETERSVGVWGERILYKINDIEHLMIGVPSHPEAILQFERLGFTVRGARGLPPMGGGPAGGKGGSALVAFKGHVAERAQTGPANYLELAFLDEPYAQEWMLPILKGVHGGAMLVLEVDGLEDLRDYWTQSGILTHPIVTFELEPVDGNRSDSSASCSVVVPKGSAHAFYVNACEYTGDGGYSDPKLTTHANSARAILGYMLEVGEMEAEACLHHFGKTFGVAGIEQDHATKFMPGNVYLDVVTRPGSAAPTIKTCDILIDDTAQLTSILKANDVPHAVEGGGIAVASQYASGLALRFVESVGD